MQLSLLAPILHEFEHRYIQKVKETGTTLYSATNTLSFCSTTPQIIPGLAEGHSVRGPNYVTESMVDSIAVVITANQGTES